MLLFLIILFIIFIIFKKIMINKKINKKDFILQLFISVIIYLMLVVVIECLWVTFNKGEIYYLNKDEIQYISTNINEITNNNGIDAKLDLQCKDRSHIYYIDFYKTFNTNKLIVWFPINKKNLITEIHINFSELYE